MKKIIPQPVVPKTEEVGQLEQEQKLSEEQKVVFIERKNDASSSEK
ncbi:19888_t:CDS:1, partial [Racocetra persica]